MKIIDFIKKYKEETIHTNKYSNTQLTQLFKKGLRTTEEVEQRRISPKKKGVSKKKYSYNNQELTIDQIYELHKKYTHSPYSLERIRQLITEWGDIDRVIRLNKPALTLTQEQYQDYLVNRTTKDEPLTFESAIHRVATYGMESLYTQDRLFMLKTKHKKKTPEDRKKQLIRWAKAYFYNGSSVRIVASEIGITANQLSYAVSFYRKNFNS